MAAPNPQINTLEAAEKLVYESRFGYVHCVRALLQQGQNPNMQDVHARLPAFVAAENGHAAVLKDLIFYGAQVDETMLVEAAANGYEDCVQVLLDANVDPDFPDGHKRKALIEAARNGRAECVRVLLEGGAHVNQVDDWHNDALTLAVDNNRVGAVKELLRGGVGVLWGSLVRKINIIREPIRQLLIAAGYKLGYLEGPPKSTTLQELSRDAVRAQLLRADRRNLLAGNRIESLPYTPQDPTLETTTIPPLIQSILLRGQEL